MGKCKAEAIQRDLGIPHIFQDIQPYSYMFMRNHVYSGTIQAYSEPYVTLAYS